MHKTSSIILIVMLLFTAVSHAETKKQGPSANVVVSKVTKGMIAPEKEFIGTIYYPEVSEVSAEVSGTVEIIRFEEGERIKKGRILVKLNSILREKTFQAKKALYEQILTDLERARKDLERIATLYKKKIVSEKDYDDQRFQVKGLEKKTTSLKTEVDRLEIELEKTNIKSPFDGVVIKRLVARGEWFSPGKSVATIARNDTLDVIVEVPEELIRYLKPGMNVKIQSGDKKLEGKLHAIIPKGDISTRTFPIKLRFDYINSLMEGMEAKVKLPGGTKVSTLMIPRDAVLNTFGKTVVVAVIEGKAKVIPIKIIGYQGTKVGVNSKNISEGMNVVVKGNERLLDGQSLNILKEVE
jgi:RND family efflux transporter MFP subunit